MKHRPLSRCAPWPLLAAFLTAQTPVPPPLPPAVRISSGVGLQSLDGELVGTGGHYKARFERGVVSFTPAFGRAAPKTCPVRVSLLGTGRGSENVPVPVPIPPVAPEHDGLRVEYRHAGVIERYDVRPEGLEQSFEFAALPPGEGDLVVRLRLDTELDVEPCGDGLRFRLPGVGSFGLGEVTGVDARGARCKGAMRLGDGVLELSLPERFVATARLPLVLDPLLGVMFNVMAQSSDDEAPRVAYSLGSDVYLVVWTRINSATDTDVLGQRVDRNGLLVGNVISVAAQAGLNGAPSVGSVRTRDAFLVAYVRNDDVLCRSVSASTGAVSLSLQLATGANVQRWPDVGGEATTADDDGVVVWVDYATNSIHSAEVGINADLSLGLRSGPRTAFHDAGNLVCDFPRISRCGGPVRRYGMTCHVEHSSADRDPMFFVLDDTGTTLTAPFVVSTGGLNDYAATCDGDGTTWVVAWERAVTASVRAASLSFRSGTVLPYVTGTERALANSARLPAVTWLGQSCLVSWFERTGNTAVCRVGGWGLMRCNVCEATQTPAGAFDLDFTAYGASTASGGNAVQPEQALLALESTASATSNGDVQAQRWDGRDGFHIDEGGGCGATGEALAPCFSQANQFFALHLRGAPASVGAALVLSQDRIDLPCGPCRLVPDPFTGVVFVTATDVLGDAAIAIPLPLGLPLVGITFHTQWLVLGTTGCAAFGAGLTAAQQIVHDL
jgi:hypothetical protein